MSFDHFRLHPVLLRGLSEKGFTVPTPIQEKAIPPALEGRDVMGRAATGSGKTAAFALPILNRLQGRPRGGTRALVLAPTRELAGQIADDFTALGRFAGVTCAAIFGGVGIGPQEKALRRGVDVVIATPGRLLDHLGRSPSLLRNLEVLVLDEADRMLDIGFLPDIRRILRLLPAARQNMLFSATLPREIVTLSKEILRDPVSLEVGSPTTKPAASVSHTVYPVPSELKAALLAELIKRGQIRSVIAFTRTKHRANRLADFLERHGVNAGRIHGNRSQGQRAQALDGLKSGTVPVLVATDIAARGIDVALLSHVVNFDVPNSPDDFVHRVGRTGRADATGEAITFVAPEDEQQLTRIERMIGHRIPRITLPDFDYRKRSTEKLEIPLGDRLAAMRSQRAGQRRPGSGSGRPRSAGGPGRSHPGARAHGAGAGRSNGGGRRRFSAGR